MERLYKNKSARKPETRHGDAPLCERCGRPVRLSSDDLTREEILCPACASEAKVSASDDYDVNSSW
ncbi:MAG: hypothetical protein ABFD49_08520 [Armatimonadota bacterium]|nr:hypothetical protein [bacterium]